MLSFETLGDIGHYRNPSPLDLVANAEILGNKSSACQGINGPRQLPCELPTLKIFKGHTFGDGSSEFEDGSSEIGDRRSEIGDWRWDHKWEMEVGRWQIGSTIFHLPSSIFES